jgi:hypothetical protein
MTGMKGSGLFLHNEQLADEANEIKRAISKLTDKGTNKTDDDHAEIARLEWFGGLYVNADGVMIPSGNVKRMLVGAARVTKQGKAVERGVFALLAEPRLEYPGPRDLDELFKASTCMDQRMVKVGRGKVKRTRPLFREWSLEIPWELITTIISSEEFKDIFEKAGVIEGLGDNRSNGYGRFTVTFKDISGLKGAKAVA